MLIVTLAFLFGVLVGNFATTLQYRLPRGIALNGFNVAFSKPPFCSNCNHPLRFWEYLPVLGWFFVRGSCNYCKHPVSFLYTLLELSVGIWAVICMWIIPDNIDNYIIFFCLGISCLLGSFIIYEHKMLPSIITTSIALEAAIYYVLQQGTIIYVLTALSLSTMIALLFLMKTDSLNNTRKIFASIVFSVSVWVLPLLIQ